MHSPVLTPNRLPLLGALDDRCAERHAVIIAGWLRPTGGHRFPVIVRDLSIAGFSCETTTRLGVGTLCWLSFPGLAGQQAEMVWNTGHMVGCAFSSLLSRVVVDNILSRYPLS